MTLKSYSGDGGITPAVTQCYDGQIAGGSDGACIQATQPASYPIGRVTQVRTSAATTTYEGFDAAGRVTGLMQTVGGENYPFAYTLSSIV
jgi:hypothetical protein